MKVKELIVWLQSQDQEMDVEVGMNQEYQNELDVDYCQVVRFDGYEYVLLGEKA